MSDHASANVTSADAREVVRRQLGQIPGFDGLRAIGVVAGIVGHASYHSGSFSAFRGVFYAILVFFILSGFLITSLLMIELENSGAIGLRAFWARRYRRLMPSALVGVVVVLAFSWFVADASQIATLRGDVAAALTYTTNWRQLFAGQVYANQFGSPTPFLHYWSLAIEEQFYLVLPVVLVVAHRVGRGRRNAIPIALGALAAASGIVVIVLATSADLNPDRMYYGTDARALEFLSGCLLGVWFTRHRNVVTTHARTFDVIGWVGFAISMYLWIAADLGDQWVYRGGLQLGIVPAAAMILGATAGGSLSRALSLRPLREVGRISYGVYVLHWPIILWVSPARTGLDATTLLPLQIAIVLAAAWCSYALIEDRVRRKRILRNPRSAIGVAALASLVLLGAAWPVSAHGPKSPFDFNELQRELDDTVAGGADEEGVRIGFFGDSSAMLISLGVWAADGHDDALAPGGTRTIFGCGISGATEVLMNTQPVSRVGCELWPERWAEAIELRPADIAVVSTAADVLPGSVDGGAYRTPSDPDGAEHLLEQMLRAVDLLHERGAHVVWLRQPPVVFGAVAGRPSDPPWPENDPEEMARYNELIDQLPDLRPGIVHVLDYDAYLTSLPGGNMDPLMRPDLLHLSFAAAEQVARDWLRPEIEAIIGELGLDPGRADAP